jgi:hypothetical protein
MLAAGQHAMAAHCCPQPGADRLLNPHLTASSSFLPGSMVLAARMQDDFKDMQRSRDARRRHATSQLRV